MRDIAFLAGFLALLPYVVGRPHIGVLLWCWTALLVPNAYVYGFATDIPFNLIVALVTLLVWVLSKEPVRVPLNRTVITLIVLGLLATLSALFAIGDHQKSWVEWEKFAKIIVFAVVVSGLINSRTRFISLIYAVALSLGFHGVVEGLKFFASAGGHHIVGPGSSIIADNNHFALAMLCTLPLIYFLYQQTNYRLLRLALLGSLGVILLSVVGTFSRGGLVGLTAMAFWSFWHSRTKIRYLLLVVPMLALTLAFAPANWFERMDTISSADQDASFMGRVIAWKQSTLIALDNPVLGGGFHAVQNFSVWKTYSLTRFHDLNFIPTNEPDPGAAHAAHSIYFQVIGDLGIVGLGLFLLLGFFAWRDTVVVVKKTRNRADLAWAGQLAQAGQYTLLAYFVAGAALSMAYFEFMYILFALLATLRQIVVREVQGA